MHSVWHLRSAIRKREGKKKLCQREVLWPSTGAQSVCASTFEQRLAHFEGGVPNIIYCPKPKSQVHMVSANDTSASLPTPDCAADFNCHLGHSSWSALNAASATRRSHCVEDGPGELMWCNICAVGFKSFHSAWSEKTLDALAVSDLNQ